MNHVALSAVLVSSLSLGAMGCSSPASLPTRSPAVAFGANLADVAQSCVPDGTQVIATHVVPGAGVTAVAEGPRLVVRFATAHHPHVALALDPETLRVLDEDPSTAQGTSDSRDPVQIELTGHRHLVAWTEGSIEAGLRPRVATLGPDGTTEVAIDFGYEGSAVGQPAVAVTRAGNGVVAFIESNGAGFQLVVTHVTCVTP